MRLRDFLPHAGWMTLAFTGFGAGAAVALVSPAPEPATVRPDDHRGRSALPDRRDNAGPGADGRGDQDL